MSDVSTASPRTIISLRRRISIADLQQFQGEALGLLWQAIQASNGRQTGAVFVRYWSMSETDTDVEVGIPTDGVAAIVPLQEGILPGGTQVVHRHLGAHDRLGAAYEMLAAAVADRAPAGPPWEEYEWIPQNSAPAPASWPAPSAWTTLLVQPLADAGETP